MSVPCRAWMMRHDRPLASHRWAAKFEGNEVPVAVEKALNEGANDRLQRRPSWAAKFEGPEGGEAKTTATPLVQSKETGPTRPVIKAGLTRTGNQPPQYIGCPPSPVSHDKADMTRAILMGGELWLGA